MLLSTKQSDILTRIANTDKKYVVGIDEVGYGCIAGPIFVSAFFAPKDWTFEGLKDSKLLSERQRKKIIENIFNTQKGIIEYAIIGASSAEIDTQGVANVMRELYKKTALIVGNPDDCLIVIDGVLKVKGMPHLSLPKGDNLVPHISAASIFAKVARDNLMVGLSEKFPQYGWAQNKGYPSKAHLAALEIHGYCEQHRCSYAPINGMIK
jgi:ribonuclease HII